MEGFVCTLGDIGVRQDMESYEAMLGISTRVVSTFANSVGESYCDFLRIGCAQS